MVNFSRGSQWRKWDLHIHTPFSIQQNYKNTPEGWEKYIKALESLPKEIEVIGITDYYFIDGYEEVMKFKQAGRLANITKIFPVLEFRIDTFGSGNENKLQKINLHVLFDLDESDLKNQIKKVKDEFIGAISVSPAEKHKTKRLSLENLAAEGGDLKTGFESLIPSTKQVFEILHNSAWKGKTFIMLGYKEWSNLEKNQQVKPLKEELYNEANAFLANNFANHSANQTWLNQFGTKVLLHSLDIHGFDLLDTYEFDEKSQKIPSVKYHCCSWIKADPTFEGLRQIIFEPDLRVKIQENLPEDKAGYQVIDRIEINNSNIVNGTIELNPNLNSIIGGRSTGKSVLLAAIAKKLKTERPVNFLPNSQYDGFVTGIAQTIRIFWKDGKEENNREIEFFQQGYMYDLARNEDKLSGLIQEILNQKGKEVAISSYYKNVSENKKRISEMIENLYQINSNIKQKNQKAVERGDKKGIEDEIKRLSSELNKLTVTEITEQEKNNYEKIKSEIQKISEARSVLATDKEKIGALRQLRIVKESISFELTSLSDSSRNAVEKSFREIRESSEARWADDLNKLVESIDSEDVKLSKSLDATSADQDYKKVFNAYSDSAQVMEFEDKIRVQRDKLFEITALIEEVDKLAVEKKEIIASIKKAHHMYVDFINGVISELSEEVDGLKIVPVGKQNMQSYGDILLSALDQRSAENQIYLSGDVARSIEKEVFEIFDRLLEEQLTLKGGNTSQTLVNRLLSENFYKLNYDLEYEGDNFAQMSDGKKAFVVLKLLLDFSNKNCPILIDQPEDDLDNRAIYTDLVQYLRRKKKLRQIIVATHNPNIVVGSDSELVIVANQHGLKNKNRGGKKFQYVSGSLEFTFKDDSVSEVLDSKGVREHVCEILEGGDIAFKMREAKYGFDIN